MAPSAGPTPRAGPASPAWQHPGTVGRWGWGAGPAGLSRSRQRLLVSPCVPRRGWSCSARASSNGQPLPAITPPQHLRGTRGGQPPPQGSPEHSCCPLNPLLSLAHPSEMADTGAGGCPSTVISSVKPKSSCGTTQVPAEQCDEEQHPPAGCSRPRQDEHQLAPFSTLTQHSATKPCCHHSHTNTPSAAKATSLPSRCRPQVLGILRHVNVPCRSPSTSKSQTAPVQGHPAQQLPQTAQGRMPHLLQPAHSLSKHRD